MTETAPQAALEPGLQGLSISKRHRAMLLEMGIKVWQPLPTPISAPLSEPLSAPSAPIPSPTVQKPQGISNAINSVAISEGKTFAKGTFDAKKPVLDATAVQDGTSTGQAGWRIGASRALYTPASTASPASAARWLVLIESPPSALQPGYDPFEGEGGKLLDNMLRAAKLHTAISAVLAPVVRESAQGGDLSASAADAFTSSQANVVLVMGRLTAQALLQSTEPLAKLRGHVHTVHGLPVVITLDPATLLRNPLDKAKAWDDLCLAISAVSAVSAGGSAPAR